MKLIVSLTIEGEDFEPFILPDFEAGRERTGYGFFCPQCAELWAVARINGREFRALSLPCCTCGSEYYPAGSVWLVWDHDWNRCLPPSALDREVEIHLNHWEKYNAQP